MTYKEEQGMTLEEMIREINRFIEQYDGTAIGGIIKNWRQNTRDDDYDGIEAIYNELEAHGYV